jgi:hypothetical protein
MSQSKRVQISSNEGRILLALSAVQSGQCKPPSAASKMYSVPRNTLYQRINGQTSREDYTPTNKRLSLIKEEVIVKNILKLDVQGFSPTIAIVKEMADSIYKAKGAPPVRVN